MKLFKKIRDGNKRTIILFGFIKIKYRKRERARYINIDELNSHIDIEELIEHIAIHSKVAAHHGGVFEKYRNLYKDRDIVICGTGETLNSYTPVPNAINIGINRAFRTKKIKFDYLFVQDLFPEGMDEFIKYRPNQCKKMFAMPSYSRMRKNNTVRPVPLSIIYKANGEYFFLDSRIEYRFAIDPTIEPIGEFGFTAMIALQFALFTNPRRIYLVGMDCTNNFFYGGGSNHDYQKPIWHKFANFVRTNFPETEIISVNPIGLCGIFKDMYQKKDKK